MDRRAFLELLAATPLAARLGADAGIPRYRVVSAYAPAAVPGMPGPWPGRVVSVKSERSLDETGRVVEAVVRDMMDRGLRGLTGEATTAAAAVAATAKVTGGERSRPGRGARRLPFGRDARPRRIVRSRRPTRARLECQPWTSR